MPTITKEELSKADGKNGAPVYVAVDGQVYDLSQSARWKEGTHFRSHSAGADLTEALKAAPHGPEVLTGRFVPIGEVVEKTAENKEKDAFAPPPALIEAILKRHPHPVSVHFPIGLGVTNALFTLLGLVFTWTELRFAPIFFVAGMMNLAVILLATPVAVGAGLLSWKYNYGGIWTSIYRWKVLLSVLFFLTAAGTLALGFYGWMLFNFNGSPLHLYVYSALNFLLAGMSMGLGYLGGKITFPS